MVKATTEELPSIARQDSKVSRTSRISEVKVAPPDMTPFLNDIEKLQQNITELASKIDSTFVTKDLFELFSGEHKNKVEDISVKVSLLQILRYSRF